MAVVVDFHQQPSPHCLKPWKRRCRLRSFPHPGPNLLLYDPPANLSPPPSSFCSPRRRPSIHRSLSTPCFSSCPVLADRGQQQQPAPRVENIGSRRAKGTHALIVETAIALASGELPIPATSGLGAAYFLRNRSNECFAVIKPIGDDPPPSSILGRHSPSRLAVHATETGVREVAAYILDHGGFSGVPPTALIRISHPALHSTAVSSPCSHVHVPRKVASIQRFVPHDFDAGDLGPSRFSVGSVHRIGILDVRLLNIDRHAGNILVRKLVPDNIDESPSPMAELVPIDHGLCLPELLDDPYFEWLHWPQATVPFSELESDYISALDPSKDAALLRAELPSLKEAAIRIMVICTVFLRKASAEGLCLADIGSMMTRELCGLEQGPSMLEALCKRAHDSIKTRSGILLEDSSSDDDADDCQGEDDDDDDDDDELNVQFEMECDDAAGFVESYMEQVIDVPLFLVSTPGVGSGSRKKQKLLGSLSDGCRSGEEEGGQCWDECEEGASNEPKTGSITRSMSLSAAPDQISYESGGSANGKCMSFVRMNEEEWGLFLESFEQMLPEAFVERKFTGLRQRLGSSCKF